MIPGTIGELAPGPLPRWFPQDAEIERMLAAHQPVYRWRRPRYALQLLKDLAALVPEGSCRLLDIGGGSGLIGQIPHQVFRGLLIEIVMLHQPLDCAGGWQVPQRRRVWCLAQRRSQARRPSRPQTPARRSLKTDGWS